MNIFIHIRTYISVDILGFENYLLIGLGGAFGAILRYATFLSFRGKDFPWATLFVNVTGSFLLSVAIFMPFHDLWSMSPLVTIGVLGAFTTFSSFSLDTLLLYEERGVRLAVLNVALNVLLCVFGALMGRYLVTLL